MVAFSPEIAYTHPWQTPGQRPRAVCSNIALHPQKVERQQEEFNMETKKKVNTRYLIELALLVAILLMMNVTGLAMIPLYRWPWAR